MPTKLDPPDDGKPKALSARPKAAEAAKIAAADPIRSALKDILGQDPQPVVYSDGATAEPMHGEGILDVNPVDPTRPGST